MNEWSKTFWHLYFKIPLPSPWPTRWCGDREFLIEVNQINTGTLPFAVKHICMISTWKKYMKIHAFNAPNFPITIGFKNR